MSVSSFFQQLLIAGFVLHLSAFSSVAAGREASLSVNVNVQNIFLGESFRLEVALNNAQVADVPMFQDLGQARIQGGQPQSQSSRSVTIINGRRSEEVIERTSWVYYVTPTEAGGYNMGQISVVLPDGRTLSAHVPIVTVAGPEPQPYVAISLSATPATVLLDEPLTLSLGITVVQLDGEHAELNPLPIGRPGQAGPPQLLVPFLAEGGVAGASFTHSLVDLLNPLLQNRAFTAGFKINDYSLDSNTSPFFFSERQAAVFHLDRETAVLNGRPAWTYRLNIPMKAVEEGVCTFPAASFKGTVYVRPDAGSEIQPVTVFAVSQPLTIKVTPPPDEGRPASFIGSLGTHLEATVTLDAQTCHQGDPLQLTLEISGNQTTANMREPRIFDNPMMAECFRQYGDVSGTKTETGMRYTYRIRPIVSGTIEVPALDLAFFNTQTRQYEVARTAPVPLRVDPVPDFDPDTLLGVSTNAIHARLTLRRTLAPSGISVSERGLDRPAPTGTVRSTLLVLVPPSAYLLILSIATFWRRRRALGRAVRRRSAVSRSARGILRAATPQQIMEAVGLLLRDKMDHLGSGITPNDVRVTLVGQGVDTATCDEITRLLQEVFDSGFSPDADPAETVRARRGRIAELFSGIRLSVMLGLVAGLSLSALGAPDNAAEFTWRQANAAAAGARTPEAFRQTAELYRAVIDAGAVNGVSLHNYGTMLLLAGQSAEAVDAFKRTEALAGATPESTGNLDLALQALRNSSRTVDYAAWEGADSATALPWFRVPLFWHYEVPLAAREETLAAAWALLWLGLVLRFFRLRRMACVLITVALVGLAVFGSSVLVSQRLLAKPLPPIPAATVDTLERTGIR